MKKLQIMCKELGWEETSNRISHELLKTKDFKKAVNNVYALWKYQMKIALWKKMQETTKH